MEKFAERYLKCNPTSFKSADVAYVLAYSVIMLNTDLHNPQVKKKMSKEAFLKNNRGINDKQDLPEDFMSALYDRIASNEIKMKDEGAELNLQPRSMSPNNIFNTLLSMLGAIKQTSRSEPSEESIKRTLDLLHEKARSATAVTVTESDAVRPMMEVIWAPLLGALSVLFDEYTDSRLVRMCLQGFSSSSCLTAQVGRLRQSCTRYPSTTLY
ncbi:SEC7 domain-containing protein [Haematococcus lacustris]|uniref:SEC7 domain-containing protein n=1 Tax=Haematococcus lacustris TaxID=44745 RepID=A0A699ZEI7_HAELA|nr:SEC7 domain-containing protein [Haematococcus lacustris]